MSVVFPIKFDACLALLSTLSLEKKKNIEGVEKDLSFNPGARAAINIALHDVYCKHTNISLGGLLGQKTSTLPTSVTVGIKSVSETIAEIEEYLAGGFKNIKIKLGEEVEKDIERMLKVQDGICQ